MAEKLPHVLQDHLGRDLKIGDPVAFFHRSRKMMHTGRIQKISKVNVTIGWDRRTYQDSRSIRASEVILLDNDAYTFHCLRADYR